MTNPANDPQYQQFLAWQQSKDATAVPVVPEDERPQQDVWDVLTHLVSIAPLPSQTIQREYVDIINAARDKYDGASGEEQPKAPNE